MENAADALKMAAFVLIFVVALSISINAFGQAQQAATTILGYKDREYDYTYVDNNGTTERIVGAETIVPSIYKAYKENYKIVFINGTNENGIPLYQKNGVDVYSIDLESETLGSDEQKEKFIKALLYGTSNLSEDEKKTFKDLKITLNEKGIYDIIKENNLKFVEQLGVYYQEEIQGSIASNANKTEKRVITYVQQ